MREAAPSTTKPQPLISSKNTRRSSRMRMREVAELDLNRPPARAEHLDEQARQRRT